MIDEYRKCRYREGGRGEVEGGTRYFDCWGLARAVRHEVFGFPLLPSYGSIMPSNVRGMTRAVNEEAPSLRKIDAPEPGAIALTWNGGICKHIGVCVELNGRPGVFEIRARGTRWLSRKSFEAFAPRVEYYT